jgi:hypothetical protein
MEHRLGFIHQALVRAWVASCVHVIALVQDGAFYGLEVQCEAARVIQKPRTNGS